MIRLILTTILFVLFGAAYACKCVGPGTVKESFNKADLVVYGEVASIDTVRLAETINVEEAKVVEQKLRDDLKRHFKMTYVLKVNLTIIEIFKGETLRHDIVIYTPLRSATCGYRFRMGEEYIVYGSGRNFLSFLFHKEEDGRAFRKEGAFWTTHCTRTSVYSKAEADELSLLKE